MDAVYAHLDAQARLVLDNALANVRLEGGDIPDELQQLAARYVAGEFDTAEFRARARAWVNPRHPATN